MEREYIFDAKKVRDRLVMSVREHASSQHFTKAVLGISGGKDSTVTAAILARALGAENVFGIMLPDGEQADLDDSIRVCRTIGIKSRIINIGGMHCELRNITDQNGFKGEEGDFIIPLRSESDINVGPRLRMTVLRYISQSLGARLAGTGNLSEATVGYCTKDGDTSCDFAVLLGLTSIEVVEVGLTMPEIPRELVEKTPADGLSGVSDEEKMGISYTDIHKYIRFGSCGNKDVDSLISGLKRANMHKRERPVVMASGLLFTRSAGKR